MSTFVEVSVGEGSLLYDADTTSSSSDVLRSRCGRERKKKQRVDSVPVEVVVGGKKIKTA